MKRFIVFSALAAASLVFSGCVTGRRIVDLPVAQLSSGQATKGSIFVGEVADTRHFENSPKHPSTPSVNGDVNTMSKEQLGVMIGRQRNAYGAAMGDIALPPVDSVERRSRAVVEEGLRRHGYSISSDPSTANTASVQVDAFWAWGTPGFAAISFEANLLCKITIKRGDITKTLIVRGYGLNKGPVASNGNWQLAYTRAFDDFMANLDKELSVAGL
jgi:hypothetical protein